MVVSLVRALACRLTVLAHSRKVSVLIMLAYASMN